MFRRFWSIRTILLLVIGVLTLSIASLVANDVSREWQKLQRVRALKNAVLLSDQLFDTTEKISVERDIAFAVLHVADKDIAADLTLRLQRSRQDVDRAFDESIRALETYHYDDLAINLAATKAQFAGLQELRRQIDTALTVPVDQRNRELSQRWFDNITALVVRMQGLWTDFTAHYTDIDPAVNLQMRFKYTLGIITEYSGRQRSMIGKLLAENIDPTPVEQGNLLQWAGATALLWDVALPLATGGALMPAIAPYLDDARSHYFSVYDMVRDIFYIPGAHARPYPISVEFWLDIAIQADDSLFALKDAALKQSREYVEGLEAQARQAIAYQAVLMLIALGLCLYTLWVVIYRVIRPINIIADALVNTTEGKTVALTFADEGRQDEIGKLAQALRGSERNVEEIRRHSAEIAHYAAALERSNHELDDFAYIASHDLKEPLRGLHNHTQFLLEDNKDKLAEDSVKRLDRLVYLSERMERLVSDLLYYSRIGRQELAEQLTDMNAVIADIRDMMDMFLTEKHARIEVPQPLPTVTCDVTRVTEVFRNLITNAVKYNDAPEKIIEIGFAGSGVMPDGTIYETIFSVKDNGRGIAPEFHNEIFRMFKRLQSGDESKEEGTGVGLTFVKKIIERHGGKIWLESDVGKGTVFYFTLKSDAREAQAV